jgi:hypothetical protein
MVAKTGCILAVLMLSSSFAFAGETWYLKVANNNSNLTNPSHWTNSVGIAATDFDSDDAYVVTSGANIRSPILKWPRGAPCPTR